MRLTISKKPQPQQRSSTDRSARPEHERQVRCGAAHTDDVSPCDGPAHAVEVIDQFAHHARGCLWHGTLLYTTLANAIMLPVLEDPAAVDGARRIAKNFRTLYWGYHHADPDTRSHP